MVGAEVYTHRVVKFIVKVKLVEKRAKRRVGKVMVVKVMSHISRPGIHLAIASTACPSKPSHEVDVVEWALIVGEGASADSGTEAVFDAVFKRELRLVECVNNDNEGESSMMKMTPLVGLRRLKMMSPHSPVADVLLAAKPY